MRCLGRIVTIIYKYQAARPGGRGAAPASLYKFVCEPSGSVSGYYTLFSVIFSSFFLLCSPRASPARLACSPFICSPRLLPPSAARLLASPRLLVCSPHRLTSSARLVCSPRPLCSSARLVCSARLLGSSDRLVCSAHLLGSTAHRICSPRLLAASPSARLVSAHELRCSAARFLLACSRSPAPLLACSLLLLSAACVLASPPGSTVLQNAQNTKIFQKPTEALFPPPRGAKPHL